jgi:hypothetical protein
MPIYTRSQLKSRINAGIKGKQGILVNADDTANQAVREVLMEHDLRSTKRGVDILPGLFDNVTEYFLPADMKGEKLVSIFDQESETGLFVNTQQVLLDRPRERQVDLEIVPFEQWHTNQKIGTVAFKENSGVRSLLVSMPSDGSTSVVSTLDALDAGGGTWGGFGDGTNVAVDTGDFIRGTGSLEYDIDASAGTTAGIVNSTLTATDLSAFFITTGAVFVFTKINSLTDLTNFELRIGSGAADYSVKTVTEQHAQTAFTTGWNLLRFDLNNITTSGTPVNTAITYIALFMNKATTKVSETGYKFDQICIKTGDIHRMNYYSKYGWQSSAGVWKENSTDDTDLLNADTDEFELFVQKGIILAGMEADETRAAETARERYRALSNMHMKNSPSDALFITDTYAEFI